MCYYLGIDTSNYTTSVALCDDECKIVQRKKLLPVKEGCLGLRQSDAVFHHTQQLHTLISELTEECPQAINNIRSIGVSTRPRDLDGSYMPCFTVGINVAKSIASLINANIFEFSHQCGHIIAALYSCNKLELIDQQFIAFHISGGTTEAVIVNPDPKKILKAEIIAQSSDLKAGQAVDRVGQMLELPFPSGVYIDKLAQQYTDKISTRISMNGLDCSLSGIENKCKKMLQEGEPQEKIARTCIEMIYTAVDNMTKGIRKTYGKLPIIYAGGVMSNSIINKKITNKYDNTYFAQPIFSSDNAVGTAILTMISDRRGL